jgi:hypothetical protein
MPSDIRHGGRRGSICDYRVKCGKKDIFRDAVKYKCTIFIKENQKNYDKKLRLVPPNI